VNLRFEIKYLLTKTEALNRLKNILIFFQGQYDKYSGENGYWVESIYFDDQYFSFYHDHLEGAFFRKKIRARCYHSHRTINPFFCSAQISVESKEKFGYGTVKKRTHLPSPPMISNLISLTQNVRDQRNYGVYPTLRPTIFIRYKRVAVEINAPSGKIRLTVDSHIEINPVDRMHILPIARYLVPPHHAIVEFKSKSLDDPVLKEITTYFGRSRLANSKYMMGMKTIFALKSWPPMIKDVNFVTMADRAQPYHHVEEEQRTVLTPV